MSSSVSKLFTWFVNDSTVDSSYLILVLLISSESFAIVILEFNNYSVVFNLSFSKIKSPAPVPSFKLKATEARLIDC